MNWEHLLLTFTFQLEFKYHIIGSRNEIVNKLRYLEQNMNMKREREVLCVSNVCPCPWTLSEHDDVTTHLIKCPLFQICLA